MKRVLVAASAIVILAGAQSFAQTVGVGPAETVVIEPEQRTIIRDYVVKERVAPVMVKERISVGATLPADVELRTVPGAWGPRLSKYRYVYSNDHVYLVEPSDRRVIQIIE
jgi:hypothetical protein